VLRNRDWGQRARRLPGHFLPRRFRLFGVGDGKTGTVTLSRKFGHYRSRHEWDGLRLIPASSAFLRGQLSDAEVRAEVRRRSRRFNLEADCGYFLSPFAGHLAEMYDDARFVLLIRDCFSWLDSRIEFALRKPSKPIGLDSMAARYGRDDEPRRPEEAALHDAGLWPIASYLRYWAELPAQVVRDVPAERLCIVRTEDLDHVNERLAMFVDVDPSTIITVHANHNETRTGLLTRVPVEHIEELVDQHCAPLMARYWGDDWRELSSRLPHG
jgi:hypothetical protein